ncbi:hypothetical protein E4U44_001647 [Claviceps purpurea]|nr:hypothetical protein E4U44_001647 [Claviceps purpurea]
MLLQTMQQMQQHSQQKLQQQTQIMQQMMEQMTKLTVKQPAPQTPTTPTRSTRNNDKNPTGTYKLTYVNTESDKSDTSMPDAASPLNQTTRHSVTEKDPDITMPDASPFVRRVTHRSVAEEDPDITMPDAPKLRKPITRPTVHAFASASKDYLDYDDFTRAQCIFLQQNKPKSVLKEELGIPATSVTGAPYPGPHLARTTKTRRCPTTMGTTATRRGL